MTAASANKLNVHFIDSVAGLRASSPASSTSPCAAVPRAMESLLSQS